MKDGKTDKPVKREREREQKRITNGKGQRKQMEKGARVEIIYFFYLEEKKKGRRKEYIKER